MSSEIKQTIESLIQQGDILLVQLADIKKSEAPLKNEFTRDMLGEAARIVTRDILELPWGGKAQKYTRTLLKQQQKRQQAEAEKIIESQFNSWLQYIRTFLSTISIVRPSMGESGNSYELITRLNGVNRYKRLESKIRNTLLVLHYISSKSLIYNRDLSNFVRRERENVEKKEIREILLSPKKPFTGTRALKSILENADGYVKIIDPYVDEETLDMLENIQKGVPILLLTSFTGGKDKEKRFIKSCQKFKVEAPGFRIRKCNPNLIHDRFILTKNKGWSVGTSLKDIGEKLSLIKEISSDTKAEMEKIYDVIWNNSTELLNLE